MLLLTDNICVEPKYFVRLDQDCSVGARPMVLRLVWRLVQQVSRGFLDRVRVSQATHYIITCFSKSLMNECSSFLCMLDVDLDVVGVEVWDG